jgi:hypothetical protein
MQGCTSKGAKYTVGRHYVPPYSPRASENERMTGIIYGWRIAFPVLVGFYFVVKPPTRRAERATSTRNTKRSARWRVLNH